MASTRAKKIAAQRARIRGPFQANLEQLGRLWTGLVEAHYGVKLPHTLPAHVVGLMLTAQKLQRAATPFGFDPDNFVDAENYLRFAEECDPRNPKHKEPKQ